MPHLPSLPDNATLLDVFRAHPATARPLIEYTQVLLRGESPLSPGERELIGAYVSGINACGYCHGVHQAVAARFGIPETTLAAALDDLDTAPVDERMKPLLRYARTLTLTPSRITGQDAAAVFEAGWDEKALHDVVSVTALFNFMNRFIEGTGLTADDEYSAEAGRQLTEHGYTSLDQML